MTDYIKISSAGEKYIHAFIIGQVNNIMHIQLPTNTCELQPQRRWTKATCKLCRFDRKYAYHGLKIYKVNSTFPGADYYEDDGT